MDSLNVGVVEVEEVAIEELNEVVFSSVYSNSFAQAAEIADNLAEAIRIMLNDPTNKDSLAYFEDGAYECKQNGEDGARHYAVLNATLRRQSEKLAKDEDCTHIDAPLSLKMVDGVPKIQEAKVKDKPETEGESSEGEGSEPEESESSIQDKFTETCKVFARSATDEDLQLAIQIIVNFKNLPKQ
tara:strand:- start:1137 stop:1691 length:555 start_codon:yes stop_codon:yes gene_type:complete